MPTVYDETFDKDGKVTSRTPREAVAPPALGDILAKLQAIATDGKRPEDMRVLAQALALALGPQVAPMPGQLP